MAKLDTAERKKLPTGDFAGPGRSYPIEDKAHAADAKARVAQFGSPALKARVDAAANKVLKASSGVAEVRPIAQSWRRDKNGSLTDAEHVGVSHPDLARVSKK